MTILSNRTWPPKILHQTWGNRWTECPGMFSRNRISSRITCLHFSLWSLLFLPSFFCLVLYNNWLPFQLPNLGSIFWFLILDQMSFVAGCTIPVSPPRRSGLGPGVGPPFKNVSCLMHPEVILNLSFQAICRSIECMKVPVPKVKYWPSFSWFTERMKLMDWIASFFSFFMQNFLKSLSPFFTTAFLLASDWIAANRYQGKNSKNKGSYFNSLFLVWLCLWLWFYIDNLEHSHSFC